MKRFIACFLGFSLIALSPGLEPYQAFAGGISKTPVQNISLSAGQVSGFPDQLRFPLKDTPGFLALPQASGPLDKPANALELPVVHVLAGGLALNGEMGLTQLGRNLTVFNNAAQADINSEDTDQELQGESSSLSPLQDLEDLSHDLNQNVQTRVNGSESGVQPLSHYFDVTGTLHPAFKPLSDSVAGSFYERLLGVFDPPVYNMHSAKPVKPVYLTVQMTEEFRESINELSRRALDKGGKRAWYASYRYRLRNELQVFLNGDASVVRKSRGRAGKAGVLKLKWRKEGLRIFFHYDPAGRTLTLLDVQLKPDLVRHGGQGEIAFYNTLADQVETLQEHIVQGLPGKQEEARKVLGFLIQEIHMGPTQNGRNGRRSHRHWRLDVDNVRHAMRPDTLEYLYLEIDPYISVRDTPGYTLNGLSPPLELSQPLDPNSYRIPWSIKFKIILFHAAQLVFLAGAATSIMLAIEPMPYLVTALTILVWRLYLKFIEFVRLRKDTAVMSFVVISIVPISELFWNSLLVSDRILSQLVSRLGINPSHRPELWMTADPGHLHAEALGLAVLPTSKIVLGGWHASRPMEEVASVMAHELGHLYLGFRMYLLQMFMSWVTKTIFYGIALGVTVSFIGHLWSWGLDFNTAFLGILWTLFSLILVPLSFLFGKFAQRQSEFGMDDFSAQLTGHPEWMITVLKAYHDSGERLKNMLRPWWRWRKSLWSFWFDSHPSLAARIRRLKRLLPGPGKGL